MLTNALSDEIRLPALMGHRGALAIAPENTIDGVLAAKGAGVDWVELDVLVTADGVPVIHHDATMARCFDDSRAVSQTASDSLPDALPTLAQMLAVMGANAMGLNLEIKRHADTDVEASVDAIMSVLDAQGGGLMGCYVSSFDLAVLARARAVAPARSRGLITKAFDSAVIEQALALDCFSINPGCDFVTAAAVDQAKRAGLQMASWTVNDPLLATQFWAMGVDCVITDDPSAIQSV